MQTTIARSELGYVCTTLPPYDSLKLFKRSSKNFPF